MTPPARTPARVSSALALGSGAVAVLLVSAGSVTGAVLAVLAWCSMLGGLYRQSRGLVSASLGLVWLAAVAASVAGAPPAVVVGCVLAGVVGWDAGQRALSLGRELTREAATEQVELLHTGTTLAVGVVSVGLAAALARVADLAATGGTVLVLVASVLGALYALARLSGDA